MRLLLFLLLLPSAVALWAAPARCAMAEGDRAWIEGALRAWELVREERLHLPERSRPPIILFDARCRFESAGEKGWSAEPHEGKIRITGGERIAVAVTSFASGGEETGPFFVMALPSVWKAAGVLADDEKALYGVFLHEYMHAAQAGSLAKAFEALEAAGAPDDLSDDSLQEEFAGDAEYVAAWERERDLLYAAAAEPDEAAARRLAAEALAAMKGRQARWLTGDAALWKLADDLFLTMEGTGQWTAYAWLAHPEGGGMTPEAARERMRGRRRWWSQDEGLALFLVVDRFLPGWQRKAFGDDPKLGIELLEAALSR